MKLIFVFQILWIAVFSVETKVVPFNKLRRIDPKSALRQAEVASNKIENTHQSSRRDKRHSFKGVHSKGRRRDLSAALSATSRLQNTICNESEEVRLQNFVTLDGSKTEAMDKLHHNKAKGISATIPSYMIGIYNKFANTHLHHASIIRSFQAKGMSLLLS